MENTKIFTNIEDVDREILLRIPRDTNLFKACSLSTYTQKLCNNYFWKQRFIRKYNVDLDYDVGPKYRINYRELYRELMDKSKDEILIYGVKNGFLELVKEMIRRGANICAKDNFALRMAAKYGYLEVVKYLIEKGADIHALNDYAFRFAAEYGHLEVVKYLIENGADIHIDDDLALKWASRFGHLEVVKYLIENGADIHAGADGPLIWAANSGYLEVVKYLLEQDADWKVIEHPSKEVRLLIDKYGKDW